MSTSSVRNQLQDLAARIQSARQALQIYPPRHPQLEQALDDCFAELTQILGNDSKIQIAYSDGEFVLGNFQIPAHGEILEEFAATLDELSTNKLIFIEGVRRWELHRFLGLLSTEASEIQERGGIEQMLAAADITNIEAGSINIDSASLPDPDILFRTWEAYSTGLKAVRSIKERVREDGTIEDVDDIRDFAYRVAELAMQESRPFLAVHALKSHDEYSFTHSTNVAMLTMAMARNLPFNEDDLREIAVAALLHDVGKERVPVEILQKPGKLTEEEWAVMNRHNLEGARMLAETEGVGRPRPDRCVRAPSRVPRGAAQRSDLESTSRLAARVLGRRLRRFALEPRVPRRLTPDEAMQIMKDDAGKKFDPVLFESFYRLVGPYPPGTVVRLESGSIAVAFANNPETPDCPQVVCVRQANGDPLDPPYPMNLASPEIHESISEVVVGEDMGIDPVNYI